MISDEQIKEIWHNTPTQGDPSGMKFAIAFARAVLSAPHQGTEHPVGSALSDADITKIATKAYAEKRLVWLGFDKDENGKYNIPVLSSSDFQLVRAVIAATPSRAPASVQDDTGEPTRAELKAAYESGYNDAAQEFVPPSALAAAPDSQGAPKQHFCEKPVAWTDNQMIAFAGFSMYSVSLQHLSIAERLEHFRSRPSDGAQAIVVDKSTPQEDK